MKTELTLSTGQKLIYSKKASKKKEGRKGYVYILYSDGMRTKIVLPKKLA